MMITERTRPPRLHGLYAITPEDPLLPRLSQRVEAALQGGVRLLQYRNKTASRAIRHAQAVEIQRLCHAYDARLIINDDLPLALKINADGIHLGRDDYSDTRDLAAARRALGTHKILGVSCYADLARAEAVAQAGVGAGANYLAFGCLYPSNTKPDAPTASLQLLDEARRFGLPIAAIGGITLNNAAATLAAGADLLAVISDVFDAPDIAERVRAYTTLIAAYSRNSRNSGT